MITLHKFTGHHCLFFVLDNRMKLLILSQRILAKQHLMPLAKYNEDYVSKFVHVIHMIITFNLKMVFTWHVILLPAGTVLYESSSWP